MKNPPDFFLHFWQKVDFRNLQFDLQTDCESRGCIRWAEVGQRGTGSLLLNPYGYWLKGRFTSKFKHNFLTNLARKNHGFFAGILVRKSVRILAQNCRKIYLKRRKPYTDTVFCSDLAENKNRFNGANRPVRSATLTHVQSGLLEQSQTIFGFGSREGSLACV